MTTILCIIGSLCLSYRFKSNALYNQYAHKMAVPIPDDLNDKKQLYEFEKRQQLNIDQYHL